MKSFFPGQVWQSKELVNDRPFKVVLLVIEGEVHHTFVSELNIFQSEGVVLTEAFFPLSREAFVQSIGEPCGSLNAGELQSLIKNFEATRPDDKGFFTIPLGGILKSL